MKVRAQELSVEHGDVSKQIVILNEMKNPFVRGDDPSLAQMTRRARSLIPIILYLICAIIYA